MTASRFDPRNLTLYDDAPPLLHLEFGGDGRVYRYAMIESYPAGALDDDTRRTENERGRAESHAQIRDRLLWVTGRSS